MKRVVNFILFFAASRDAPWRTHISEPKWHFTEAGNWSVSHLFLGFPSRNIVHWRNEKQRIKFHRSGVIILYMTYRKLRISTTKLYLGQISLISLHFEDFRSHNKDIKSPITRWIKLVERFKVSRKTLIDHL